MGTSWLPWQRQDPRRKLLERAKPHLVERFAGLGVTWVHFMEGFPLLDDFGVWLCTETDAQRDHLGIEDPRLEEIRQVLMDAGFTAGQLTGLRSTAESQETVDRVYAGNWYHAMK